MSVEVKNDKANVLMRHRGSLEDRDRALGSGARATKDFLEQFEGDERLGVALSIASVLGAAIQETLGEDETAAFYAREIANPGLLRELAESVDGVRWMAGVAGTAEYIQSTIADEK